MIKLLSVFLIFSSQVSESGFVQNGFHYSLMYNNLTVAAFKNNAVTSEMIQQERFIIGRITDAVDGNPICEASVFLAKTTVGTTTDSEGYYQLKIPGEGSYLLTISHVGYQSVFKDIDPGNISIVYDASLQIKNMEEVTISTKVRFRQNDINLFWRTILGKNPSKRTIQATNPEAVFYYYNSDTRILRVNCRVPLHIINYETGYHIQYILNYFTHDYNTGKSDWNYQTVFTELQPKNLQEKNRWRKKREEIYKVSLTAFIKSLYHNTLQINGFVLADFHLNPDPLNPFHLSLLSTDRILSAPSADKSKALNLTNRQVMLICYGKPVNDYDLAKLHASQYVSEPLEGNGLVRNLLQCESLRIFPDGTFSNRLNIAPVNFSSSLVGLNMILPIEYMPDTSPLSSTIAENAHKAIYDFDDVAQRFDMQLNAFPQEKIHLHTDRDLYVPGEKIWFKAYVTDALTHQYPTNSRYVYAELIDARDSLICRVMIRPENNMHFGYLFLPENITEGNYTLRAYTRYMENLGDNYFFKKNIRIRNTSSTKKQINETGHSSTALTNRSVSERRTTDDYDVSFFPEGGNLVEGVSCKVAFKALNSNGYSATISGEIVDSDGSVITSIQICYAGMGVFNLVQDHGKKYFLKCRNENGLEKKFELPHSDPRAYALTFSHTNKTLTVSVQKSAHIPAIHCYLLAHCRGKVLYFSSWNHENKTVIFSKEDLPSGVIQFILFDGEMNPLSERLAFSKNNDKAMVEFHTGKDIYERRENVIATLSLTDSFGNLLDGHLSVAITDDMDIDVDSTTTILSSLLLSSELKGYIETPAWYLKDDDKSTTALDYLMMTHGWRRYNIPEVVKGNPEYPSIPFQTYQKISGNLKSIKRTVAAAGNEVLIQVNNGDFGIKSTDKNGEFIFSNFEYPDSTIFFLRAFDKRGNNRVELVLDGESYPRLIHAPQSPVTVIAGSHDQTKNEPETEAFIAKAEQRFNFDNDEWHLQLSEVKITAPRIMREEEPRLKYWANEGSDVTIRREEIERSASRTVIDLIRTNAGPGVQVLDKLILIRGASNLREGIVLPLVVIDGLPFEWIPPVSEPLEDISVNEVESIDIFRGTGTSLFGSRGAGGIISITTRVGGENSRNESDELNYIRHTPLGYQTPIEFYAPKYETLDTKRKSIPDYRTTVYWKPDIIISDAQEATFNFYTSDFPTTYSVVIEGLTSDGMFIRQVNKIQVR